MDLELKSASFEKFYSPSHQSQTISPLWEDKTKVDTEMEPTVYDPDEPGTSQQHEEDNSREQAPNEDPTSALEWENGIGTLAGSDIKFRLNEHGDIVVITEDIDLETSEKQEQHPGNHENQETAKVQEDRAQEDDSCPYKHNQEDVLLETAGNFDGDPEVSEPQDANDIQESEKTKDSEMNSMMESSIEESTVDKDRESHMTASRIQVSMEASPQQAQEDEEVVSSSQNHKEASMEESTLEDNLDTFDPVLSEDIATMLYDNVDGSTNTLDKKKSQHRVSREENKEIIPEQVPSPAVSDPSLPEKKIQPPPQDKCIICGRPSKLRRFCSRQCLGKNAVLARKAAYHANAVKKMKYKKKHHGSSFEKEHANDVLTVVQDETDGKRNDLKIKIRWSSSSSEQVAESLPKRRATTTANYAAGGRGSRRKKFTWANYLMEENATAAHPDAFEDVTGRDPFPTQNTFQCNMALEGVDPEHESLICALSVAEVQGCRIRLRFCGYSESFDFWRDTDSPLIFSCGFCHKTGRTLQPPKGYNSHTFNWGRYTQACGLTPAPSDCFLSNDGHCLFQVGDKIEAVDKHNPELICVATIQNVIHDQVLIHFDGWNHDYDYWCHSTSQYIHPVGWCSKNNKHLTPPDDYPEKEEFSWTRYLSTTQSKVPDESTFTTKMHKFKIGMKLEAVDPRNKILVRVATISELKGFEAKIHFDGWSDMYDFWTNLDTADIHPMGWCKKTGHSLQPPITHEDLLDESWQGNGCPIPGCKGIGHVRGSKFSSHYSEFGCPYSPQNLAKEPARDRLTPYRTRKSCQTIAENNFNGDDDEDDPDYDGFDAKTRENSTVFTRRRRSALATSQAAGRKRSHEDLEADAIEVEDAKGSIAKVVTKWSIQQVASFIEGLTSNSTYSTIFTKEEIDGEAMLMLTQSDICRVLNIKLGPAIKIFNAILTIKDAE